jgi:ATP adenylyltransferase
LAAAGKPDGCIFCTASRDNDDRKHLIVHRAVHNFIILNRYPYTSGHLMVVPYQHAASLGEVAEEAITELMLLARTAEGHLRALYKPNGLNLGINLGEAAGAGIAGHLHLHALPRWTGDANFMTGVGETRVLPETLETTWERLAAAFRG